MYCWGFNASLFQVFLALENKDINNIYLILYNTKSKKLKYKIIYASTSDSASAILITKDKDKKPCFFKQELFSKLALKETLPLSAYKKGDDCLIVDNNLIFNFLQDNLKEFFYSFFDEVNIKNIDTFLISCANNFVYTKILELLNLDKNKCFNEVFKHYGNNDINNIPLNLSLYNGGGIVKFA
ncbi:3-oxoacyl-ACP synthase [Campylobacter sp. LR291e]|uniref:3-oxoacyl-ACP synthase n=1 Tax=Campylobacter sp. LR291e TaxID=2593546 RepID=UPI0012384FC4|nr:3-oxoacyl-ACP synthase [Campylobacter sp. LR291e]KAA6233631.1 3-oxoacyl-ACP synthase [Campylobacter sp. LR291e]